MFKVNILYPASQKKFDQDAFVAHMKSYRQQFGSLCIGSSIEVGDGRVFPSSYRAIGSYWFESKEKAYEAIEPVLMEMADDITKFTDGEATITATMTID